MAKEEVNSGDRDTSLVFKEECYAIQGAVFEVYRQMGCGFLEGVYQECMERELAGRNIPYAAQHELEIAYKGQPLAQTYRADIVCYEKIIVELKAAKKVTAEHQAQVFNYLKASGLRLGLIVNFGHYPRAEIVRVVT
jgi:GxxExxY protein